MIPARKIHLRVLALLAAGLLYPSLMAPAPFAAEKKAPAWVLSTPAPDATYTWFVGYSDGATEVEATDSATATMIAEIMRYIGVRVTTDTTATARASTKSYESDLVQVVRQSTSSRVSGFQITEKYSTQKGAVVTVYILGRYATKDLEGEKRRIAALFKEKADAVAIPESEGIALRDEGDSVGAAKRFIAAAVAASGSDIENADIKFRRNIDQARDSLSPLVIEKLNDRLESRPGAPFSEPFRAKVTSAGKPLSGVGVLVSYQAKTPGGKLVTKTVPLVSGESGLVSFSHPAPNFVGKAVLTMRLDLSSSVEPLSSVKDAFLPLVASLEDAVAEKRVAFDYSVVSAARSVSTAVIVVDTDPAGNGAVGVSSSSLIEALSRAGFAVSSAALSPAAVSGKTDTEVLASAKGVIKAQRLAFGTTTIVSVKDERGQTIATVSADIRVLDLATGAVLYSAARQGSAIGASEIAALEAARRELFRKTLGEDMAASLP